MQTSQVDVDFGPLAIAIEDGCVPHALTNDQRLCGLDVLVVDYDTDGAEETYHVPQKPGSECTPEAVLYDQEVGLATEIDLDDLWRRFREVGPDHRTNDF
jgi:hypothetical protein